MRRAADADESNGTTGGAVGHRNRDQFGDWTVRNRSRRQVLDAADSGPSLASVVEGDADLLRLPQEGKETQRVWATCAGKCPGRLAQGKGDPRGFRTEVGRARHRNREAAVFNAKIPP